MNRCIQRARRRRKRLRPVTLPAVPKSIAMSRPIPAVLLALLLALPMAPVSAQSAYGSTAPAPARPTPRDIALASPEPIWLRNGMLVEQGGRGLYTFKPDLPGQSTCDAACERLWPPHYADPGARPRGPFTIARSRDGRPMWAWKGRPLYRWVSDRRRGSAGGEGVADAWYLVRAEGPDLGYVTPYFPMPMPRPGQPWVPTPLRSATERFQP